jgi:hypothetical protein
MSSAGARKRSRESSDAPAQRVIPPKRVLVQPADDLDEVLVKCRALKEELKQKALAKADAEPDEIPSGIVEVAELTSTEVLEGIEGFALTIASTVLNRKGFSMNIPSRAASVSVSYVNLSD